METITSIASIEGRQWLRRAYEVLREQLNQKHRSALWITWKLATTEKEFIKYIPDMPITIEEPLGIGRGTGVWLQEIINRYYYPQVNALVYFGAALLLILIGLNRFIDLHRSFVIAGIILEASLLLLLFIVLLFTPVETEAGGTAESTPDAELTRTMVQDLLRDVSDISQDYARLTDQMATITETLKELTSLQHRLTETLTPLAQALQQFLPPPPYLRDALQDTAQALSALQEEIIKLKAATDKLHADNVRQIVRQELETLLLHRLSQR